MPDIIAFGVVCLIGIVICLAIAAWAGYHRRYWRGLFALATAIAVMFIYLTAWNVATIQAELRDREARPIYEPIHDTVGWD